MSVDKKLLYQHVSRCVWHDGLRLYDNDVPGTMKDVNVLRAGCLRLQQHNSDAEKLIFDASDNELADVLNLIEPGVEKEHNLSGHFRWVAQHESRRTTLRDLLVQGKYAEIRSLYYNHQNHNSNARYLLSCVSNGYIADLIKRL